MGYKVAITGLYGTGSSAVIDILRGSSECFHKTEYEYEHMFLYNPNSIFDLEYKLLFNNDVHRSNEAIKSFYKEMKRLNDNDFGWFGSYGKMFGNRFMNIVNRFINGLIHYQTDLISYADYDKVKFSIMKLFLQLAAKILQGRKIHKWGRKYVFTKDSKKQVLSFPTEDEFYKLSKEFIDEYIELFSQNERITILDHFVLPHHLHKVDKYFDNTYKFIHVVRDPRDLFIMNKYVWKSSNAFPTDVNVFCEYFKKTRQYLKYSDNESIMTVYFEDLIYKTDETINKIKEFCHINGDINFKYFDVKKSINNTQNFLIDPQWNEEVKCIEKELCEYLYNFPFSRKPNKKDTFE